MGIELNVNSNSRWVNRPPSGKYNHAAMYTLRAGRALPHGGYQTALLALVCNFGSPLLSHHQMETLFHEFGHAMHSLLSRTHFQVPAAHAAPSGRHRCGRDP
jgi:Zn-dependent oligopeptidase